MISSYSRDLGLILDSDKFFEHITKEIKMENINHDNENERYIPILVSVGFQPNTLLTSDYNKPPRRILIVEDDLSLKKVIKRSLKMLDKNIEIEWSSSADEFLEKQRKQKKQNGPTFDLVLADINMPGANSGFEVWNHFTSLDPTIPVVIMSGLKESEFKKVIGEKVAIHYLQKPLSLEKCKTVLELTSPA